MLECNETTTGSFSELPHSLRSLILTPNCRMTINASLPQSVQSLDLVNNAKIAGGVPKLPLPFQSLDLGADEKNTEGVSKLPHSLQSLHLRYNDNVTGGVSELPQSLQSRTTARDAVFSDSPWADVPQPTTHVCTDPCWCYTHHKCVLWDPVLRRVISCRV